jgi:hypothetical protein
MVGNSIFKMRFRAHGVNSNNITKWIVDNIKVEAVITPDPPVVGAYLDGTDVVLSWDAVDGATGYKVYGSTDITAEFPSAWNLIQNSPSTSLIYDTASVDYMYFRVVTVIEGRISNIIQPRVTPIRRSSTVKPIK